MRSCTVSAPVQSCSASLPSSNSKYAAVELLTKQRLYFVVEVKSRAKDLYSQTCSYLGDQGMLDTELFGLAIVVDGEYLFVDPESKLSKHAPKHWKSSHGHGLDGNGRPSLVLYFRVQFYVDSPLLLRDNESRHHYYLQLRHNVLSRGLLHACASEELLYLLAGLALQADLGDYTPQQHTGNYFNPAEYFPSQMVSSSEQQIMQNLPALHRDNQGMGGEEAKLLYIREASSAEVSPLTHNSHLYRLRHKKQEQGPGSVWLAICAKGIQIYEENSAKTLTATFLWTNIGKLIFDKKKFEIRAHNSLVSEEKYTYYTNTDEKSKHLLLLCRATHQFSMAIQPRLSELKRKEEEDIKRYREWLLPATCKTHLNDQRTSVISNTSSNTTSGIVSDRVQSLDESEDDLEVEIMITSPPAPSVESLALAHLRDGPSPIPKGSDEVDHCLTSARPQKSSPSSSNGGAGGAITPATTDGSQCSSSCSTVVVAATPGSVSSTTPRSDQQITLSRRRASTSSSLELGYSHTAQNSSVSEDCIGGIDYSVQSAHTSSGVYTLGGETTTATASSQATSSGVFAGGSRSSAGSVASFRGDGSDPPDAPPRSPLSAAELSDLIVGRPLPASDDYPPPPLPPPRTDSDSRYNNGSDELIIPEHLSQSQHSLLNQQQNLLTSQLRISQPEEAPARFITTRPHINILTAHTSLVPPTAAPSYAAPTLTYQSANNVIYSPSMKPKPIPAPRRLPLPAQPHLGTSFLGGYASIDPGAKMKVSAPVQPSLIIGKNNYLDVHATRAGSGMLRSTVALAATSPGSSYSAGSGSQYVGAAGTGLMRQNINLGATSPSSSYSAGSCSQFITGCIPGSGMLRSTVALAGASPGSSYSAGSGGQFVTNAVPNTSILRSTVALGTSSPGSSYSAGSGSQFIHSHPHPHLHTQPFSPPPPPLHHRQPPPPPPPSIPGQSLATVYTSQVTRGQIEQFQQQMFSDVDYVIYPMRDPSVSKQEYMDAKQGSLIARHCYQNPPPYYPEGRYMYRSTPNVALAVPVTFSGKYASNQNLTASHYPASLYSCSSSSTQSLRYEPQQAMVFPEFLPLGGQSLSQFGRARSDDNILNSYDKPAVTTSFVEMPKYRRLPPPPPPPPYEEQTSEKRAVVQESGKGSKQGEGEGVLDIRTLREKSKNLDLPLISALCNDRSLLKQTNAFVMPRHPGSSERPTSWHETSSSGIVGSESSKKSGSNNNGSTLLSAILPGSKHSGNGGHSKLKYPVSGLSTTQISKPQRKVSASTHTHPHAHPELKTKVKNKHREALMP